MGRAVVAASDPAAQAGGEEILSDGGNASDAVVAGVLAAGVARSDVLLAPLVAVVGGVGAGAKLFDGRCCQPGLGEKRPRGFTESEVIPAAARSAAPRSVATLALMHAYSTQRPLSALVRAAQKTAKQSAHDDGLDARLVVLDTFLQQGAATLTHHARDLIRAAGTSSGGLLSKQDLTQGPVETPLTFRPDGENEVAAATFSEPEPRGGHDRTVEVIVAADGRGLVAAACYAPSTNGVLVVELGLRLADTAVPVRRGVPRVTPGTPLWTPHAIELRRRAQTGFYAAAAGELVAATERGRTAILTPA